MHPAETHPMRARLHYLAAALVLGIYGVQVCPFLETLSLIQLVLPILVALAVQLRLRGPLRTRWVLTAAERDQGGRVMALELGLFLAGGLGLALYNALVHQFPLESGLKVVVGMGALGFFAATDLTLAWQRGQLERYRRHGGQMELARRFFPLSGRIGLFAASCVLLATGIILLLINKDLIWLTEGRHIPIAEARMAILGEIAFVVTLLLLHIFNVIRAYARNLHAMFDNQNEVLGQVIAGDLDRHVAVGSNDEFGLMAERTNRMIDSLRGTTDEIRQTRDVTIRTLASLAETRDNETGAHILRTQRYVLALAEQLRDHPRFAAELDDETIDLLFKSAPLHDVGKVGIPDCILLKPGRLTDAEFEIMKTHTTLGAEALAVAERELGSNSFLRFAREIALTHQEKWDGSGYPAGLAGDAIPLSGRLMAVADVYDALISRRVYKPAFSHEESCRIMRDGRGSHFDPDICDAFIALEGRFAEIAAEYGDEHTRDPA